MGGNNTGKTAAIIQFEPGNICCTPGILKALGSQDLAETVLLTLLHRHLTGDFGNVCEASAEANRKAIASGNTIVSKYVMNTANGLVPVYLITEHDRSITTLLLPSEN